MDGLEVQKEMARIGVDMPVVILTGHADVGVAVKAMRAGAINFIEKPYAKETLIFAIEDAYLWLDRNHDKVLKAGEARVRLASLTGRERDVLNGLVAGHPNKTIAYDLGISPRTVEIYRANMMEKLSPMRVCSGRMIILRMPRLCASSSKQFSGTKNGATT